MMRRVGGRGGALVREGLEKESGVVGTVARGTLVEVVGEGVAADGTPRVELRAPVRGWASASRLEAAGDGAGGDGEPRSQRSAEEPRAAEYEASFAAAGAPLESFCGWEVLERPLRAALGRRRTVLDVGCGTSGLVAALAGAGFDARGVDAAAAAVAGRGAAYAVCDARRLGAAAVAGLYGGARTVDALVDNGLTDALFGYSESRSAVSAFLDAARTVLGAGGVLVVVSSLRCGGRYEDAAPEAWDPARNPNRFGIRFDASVPERMFGGFLSERRGTTGSLQTGRSQETVGKTEFDLTAEREF